MTNDKDDKLFRFFKWEVYQNAQEVFVEIVSVVRKLPSDLRYTVGNQILRSALSVVLNIAEGSGRTTDKEMSRFFDISLGSVNETVAGLDGLLRLEHLSEEEFEAFFAKYTSVSKQLGGFKKKLSSVTSNRS